MKPLDFQTLFQSMQEVLQEDFQEEVEILIRDCPISVESLAANDADSLFERFSQWLEINLKVLGDLSCLTSLGRSHCKQILQKLGGVILTATSQTELITTIHRQLGIPALEVMGRAYYLFECKRLL